MRFLLNDRLAPITNTLTFVKADPNLFATAFMDWWAGIPDDIRSLGVRRSKVKGDLETIIMKLAPFSNDARRYLLIGTNSEWTLYLDNGFTGTDPAHPSHLRKVVGCYGVRTVATPRTKTSYMKDGPGRVGNVMFELWGPEPNPVLNYVRTLAVHTELSRQTWEESGEPLDFEDTEQYKARLIRERFTVEMLEDYCRHLGIRLFEEDFYNPTSEAIMIEKTGPRYEHTTDYSLQQLQANILTDEERWAISSGEYIY